MKYLLLVLLSINYAMAHPVGFVNSVSLTSSNSGDMSSNMIHYSPEYWYSFGVMNMGQVNINYTGAYMGLLLKRWNKTNSQGNTYVYGSTGLNSHNNERMSNYGFQADFETRRVYVLYNFDKLESYSLLKKNHKSRIGFAPYKGNFNELNIWAIAEYNSSDQEIMPLLRMYYKNVLWEIGKNKNKTMFNFSIREFF